MVFEILCEPYFQCLPNNPSAGETILKQFSIVSGWAAKDMVYSESFSVFFFLFPQDGFPEVERLVQRFLMF